MIAQRDGGGHIGRPGKSVSFPVPQGTEIGCIQDFSRRVMVTLKVCPSRTPDRAGRPTHHASLLGHAPSCWAALLGI